LTPTPTPTTDPASFTATPDSSELGLGTVEGLPPAQKLASAMVVFPLVVSEVGSGIAASGGIASGATEDTRIELVNMSGETQTLQCFYVRAQLNQLNKTECLEVGFIVSLTAEQPLTWLASEGTNNPLTFTAVPPFDGLGELKCAVMPRRQQVNAHNVIQGRAMVFDAPSGETAAYGAIGFQRLTDGDFGGVVNLDGFTYEACPQRLHFQVLTSNSVSSLLVLVPCAQDLLTQTPTSTAVQLAIVNEFEQVFSSSFIFACHTTRSFSTIGTLRHSVLGTDTAHVVVRGVSSPLTGLVVDRFDALGQQTTVNEPFLEGGRDATVIFP
jgi:hypothetical protein